MRRIGPLLLPLALLGLLLPGPLALAAATIPRESYPSLLRQIDAKKGDPQRAIAATVDAKKHHVRVTLADGSRLRVVYQAAQDKVLIDTLLRHHVKLTYTTTKPVRHTLRYIAAGVVAALLLIGAGVWLYTRGGEQESEPSESSTQ